MALTREQRIEMIEKDRKIRIRVGTLMYRAAVTLTEEFNIAYFDAINELVRWGQLKTEEGD